MVDESAVVILRVIRCPIARERLHMRVTGFLALLGIGGLTFLAACMSCPPGQTPGCPPIPIAIPYVRD